MMDFTVYTVSGMPPNTLGFYGNNGVYESRQPLYLINPEDHKCHDDWSHWYRFGNSKMRRSCGSCRIIEERDITDTDLLNVYFNNRPVLKGDWKDLTLDDIHKEFGSEYGAYRVAAPEDNILLASYSSSGYEGWAFVLFINSFKLYEVNASHCSCYGLEGQWQPEEATVEELRRRVILGCLGREYDPYVVELLDFLDNYELYIKQVEQAGLI